jgi:hypothetical protein
MTPSPDYERNIFLNCPFDDEYQPLFRAVMFAVLTCGFRARCALEADDGGEVRIAKIQRIIRDSQLGIHDISRTELDLATGLPRFNMPFELGLFLGAREFGAGQQRKKRALILDGRAIPLPEVLLRHLRAGYQGARGPSGESDPRRAQLAGDVAARVGAAAFGGGGVAAVQDLCGRSGASLP